MARNTKTTSVRKPIMRPATAMRKITWDGKPRRSSKKK